MNGMRRFMLDFVNLGFALFGSLVAARATDAHDRWLGIACVLFFGSGFATMALLRGANRGLEAAPSLALRLDDSGPRLDRLELNIAPARIAIYLSATQFFFAGGVLCVVVSGGIVAIVAGLASFALAVCGLLACVVTLRRRAPVIVLDVDSLTYWRPFRAPSTVRYSDVGELCILEVASQRFVAIQAISFAAMAASEGNERARRALTSNLRWNGAPHVLPNLVAPSAEQLIALIRPYIDADLQRRKILPLDGDCNSSFNAARRMGNRPASSSKLRLIKTRAIPACDVGSRSASRYPRERDVSAHC